MRPAGEFLAAAPDDVGIEFPVFVFGDADWSAGEVRRVLREAAAIYARECRFALRPQPPRYLDIRPRIPQLDEPSQASLLARLGDIDRPAVFFVGDVRGGDIAFAYLRGSVSPSQGTAWISRRAARACRGPLLAHEIGHILLEAGTHRRDTANLMAHSCRSSNLVNHAPNTELDRQQCEILWRRYAPGSD